MTNIFPDLESLIRGLEACDDSEKVDTDFMVEGKQYHLSAWQSINLLTKQRVYTVEISYDP